jgi:hypothetical protein
LLVGVLLALLTGCTTQGSNVPINYRWASVQGSQFEEAQADKPKGDFLVPVIPSGM